MPFTARLLTQLEKSKRRFGAGDEARTTELLTKLARLRFKDSESLIRFHEALLFIRSHPQGPDALRIAEELLSTFEERVDKLRSSGIDFTPFDYIEYSGIAGTVISGAFSYDIVRFLARTHPGSIEIDWNGYDRRDRLGATLPRLVPLLFEDSLVEANIPYLDWLRAAAGEHQSLAEWLLAGFERLKLPEREKGELFDSLGLRVRWKLGASRASRTRNMRRARRVFYHTKPLISRREVSLDEEFQAPPIALEKLSRDAGLAMQDMLRDTTTVRYRELYGITHGDPASVQRADIGRGVEVYLWGLPPERRLPLRAYHAGFTLKNGVPINYIEGISICERMEIGFNTFYTFREGESAWVYAKVLRLLNQIVGVTCISIDPYQLGFNNDEAIESGAFWFYRKLGFRPTRPDLASLTAAEEKKVAADSKYRTPPRVLRRLSQVNVIYEAPGSSHGEWDRFAIRKLGLTVGRRMAREFGGVADRIREASSMEAAEALGLRRDSLNERQRCAFEDLALVLNLIPDLADWTVDQKRAVIQIVRAKAGRDESIYARRLQKHKRLRDAIIKIGS
ncbi:MAG TPA: hypothetical protein VGL29_17770 [Blastocatellia bacterium]